MKSITFCLPGKTTNEVFEILQTNELSYYHKGLDQNYNLLIQVNYKEEQSAIIKSITDLLKKTVQDDLKFALDLLKLAEILFPQTKQKAA